MTPIDQLLSGFYYEEEADSVNYSFNDPYFHFFGNPKQHIIKIHETYRIIY